MNDKELLKALVGADFLDSDRADKILKETFAIRKSAEEIIQDRHLVSEAEVAKIKSQLLRVPYKKINVDEIRDEVLKLIPQETCRNYKVFPISRDKDLLIVGMVHPDDTAAQDALRFIAKQNHVNLGVFLVAPSDLEAVLRRYSPFVTEIQAALRAVKPSKEAAEIQKIVRLEEGIEAAEEAPIIKIVASALKEAVDLKSSDIHIEPQRSRARIRFRIEGDLQEAASLPIELSQPIISRIKILSNLKIDETRIPQDGRFRAVISNREIDFRVSTFPTPAGEKAAIRVLDPEIGLKNLDELGLNPENEKAIREGIQKPFGMILITGPTGSGKTTTLYAFMRILNKENVNIISLEDPVEYSIEGINQSQVRPEIGYDFASGLRQILRQDPDIMMVGEIRDRETAGLAVHAALTGHILLSTLHTNNAIGVIPRLVDMGVERFLLPSSLNLMVAQRLVSKLCQRCKKSEPASAEINRIIKEDLENLPSELKARIKTKEPFQIYHSAGCPACKNKGVSGRVALFEVFKMTSQLAAIIHKELTESKILEEAGRQGMITLRQDGIFKALEGLISIEEALRETA